MQECIKRLLELIGQSPWLYLFLASRPIPRVMALLEDDAGTNAVHHYDLQQDLMNRRDVRMFLESTVPRIPKYASFLEAHPGYLKRLVDRAGGLFIFARIALNVLNQDLYRNNPEEGFQVVLSSETGLDKMDALYLGILRAEFPSRDLAQSPRLHARLLSFLHVIALLATPQRLSCVALFADAIYDHKFILERVEGDAKKEKTLTIDDFRPLVDLLRSVIHVGSSGGLTKLIHISFYEFLVDRCSDPHYHVDGGAGHAGLVIACLPLVSITSLKDTARPPSLNPTIGGAERWKLTFKEEALLCACSTRSLRRHLRKAAHNERTMDAVYAITTTAWVPCWMRICAVRFARKSAPHQLIDIEGSPGIGLRLRLMLRDVCDLLSLPQDWEEGCAEYNKSTRDVMEKRGGYQEEDGWKQWKEVWKALEEDPVLKSSWYREQAEDDDLDYYCWYTVALEVVCLREGDDAVYGRLKRWSSLALPTTSPLLLLLLVLLAGSDGHPVLIVVIIARAILSLPLCAALSFSAYFVWVNPLPAILPPRPPYHHILILTALSRQRPLLLAQASLPRAM
ncbi:hypothetical protein NUW54_g9348 [Trametes sanguinea]|uniref:Uncharacterized protein n=1 Tax=Trametes sanguinea TaxID=158606 RepID=A0ACC1P809_9APHY|nr:hypothetical protein NUW54_g9348 [Trametes sanguinea]